MNEKTTALTGRLRWKKHPAETGLSRIGAGPRSSRYTDGVTDYASVNAHSFRHTGKTGWYWVSNLDGVYVNTCNDKPLDEATAKQKAQAHVKEVIKARPA